MLAVLALLVFFMFRNGRKRQKEQASLQSQMVAGANVMTNFGMYGTILSIDEEANKVELEIAPGTVVQMHRQAISRVVEPAVTADDADAELESSVDDTHTARLNEDDAIVMGEPEFGERIADDAPSTDSTKSDPTKGDA
ncbi:preprotein translocase subunit YajC [Cryobacterium zhongshanensis]|uniref:Preprotein translocase subunit YajC n=1 Tax=Cryobacterium zhongshanensis TaxID=2928153 RepID=A0AA41QX41_9MICO|nr:preprotein translocase subunit YajC [Cryobacterium zhongshanensis]MCI4657526.1 preprotein translocase subunit YajC [Cryobacterium zhongshanensis]